MALLGVLPRKNPLTDWRKIWHGWLRRGPSSTPNGMSIGSGAWPPRRGDMVMVCAFLFVHQRS